MDRKFYRAIDANLNRVREALRVAEDVARFLLDSPTLTRGLKTIRHGVSDCIRTLPRYRSEIIVSRAPDTDVGRPTLACELKRRDAADILFANIERAKESLRVLEEFFKIVDGERAERFKGLRYELYAIEKKAACRLASLRGRR